MSFGDNQVSFAKATHEEKGRCLIKTATKSTCCEVDAGNASLHDKWGSKKQAESSVSAN